MPTGQDFVSTLNAGPPFQTTSGTALASSTTLSDISPSAGSVDYTLPAPLLRGMVFRLTATGIYSTTSTPTLLIAFGYGSTSNLLASSGAVTTPSGASNNTWVAQAIMRVATEGSSGTALTIGFVTGISSATAVNMMPATSSTGGSLTLNTTTSNALLVAAQWGTSSASNTVTCYTFTVEQL